MATKKRKTAKTTKKTKKTKTIIVAAVEVKPKARAIATVSKASRVADPPKAKAAAKAKTAVVPQPLKAKTTGKETKAKRPAKAKARTTNKSKPRVETVPPAPRPAPRIGAVAPDFTLAADDGRDVSLSSLRGKNVVLYFYPRDMTPGCTIEACAFRDAHRDLESQDAVVIGVSRDPVSTHAKFKAK